MAKLTVRKPGDVPERSTGSKLVRERQAMYERFVREIGATGVGELELDPADNLRGVKISLSRAAKRIARTIEVWDADGRVYFRTTVPKRPRSTASG